MVLNVSQIPENVYSYVTAVDPSGRRRLDTLTRISSLESLNTIPIEKSRVVQIPNLTLKEGGLNALSKEEVVAFAQFYLVDKTNLLPLLDLASLDDNDIEDLKEKKVILIKCFFRHIKQKPKSLSKFIHSIQLTQILWAKKMNRVDFEGLTQAIVDHDLHFYETHSSFCQSDFSEIFEMRPGELLSNAKSDRVLRSRIMEDRDLRKRFKAIHLADRLLKEASRMCKTDSPKTQSIKNSLSIAKVRVKMEEFDTAREMIADASPQADKLENQRKRERAYLQILSAHAAVGDMDLAEKAKQKIKNPSLQDQIKYRLTKGFTLYGQTSRAKESANQIQDPLMKAKAWAGIAKAFAHFEKFEQTKSALEESLDYSRYHLEPFFEDSRALYVLDQSSPKTEWIMGISKIILNYIESILGAQFDLESKDEFHFLMARHYSVLLNVEQALEYSNKIADSRLKSRAQLHVIKALATLGKYKEALEIVNSFTQYFFKVEGRTFLASGIMDDLRLESIQN